MKMNIGSVKSGYHVISFIAAEKPISEPPVPQSSRAEATPTKPIAPNTRCPVISISIIVENIRIAIILVGHQDRSSVAAASSIPRILAMSLKNSAITWRSIKKIPRHMMILIGQR